MALSLGLGLPLLAAAQAQKHVTHNEALLKLDVLTQLSVQALSAAPPSSPVEGAVYLVAPEASGAFAGHDGDIAQWRDGLWNMMAPRHGWQAFVEAEGRVHLFDATRGRWRPVMALSASGAATGLHIAEEEVVLAGAFVSTSALIRDRDLVLGVTCRVTQAITGASSFSVGTASDATRFGSLLSVMGGSVNVGVIGPQPFYADTSIIVTPAGGSFTGGKLSLAVHVMRLDCSQP